MGAISNFTQPPDNQVKPMKKILLVLIFSMLVCPVVNASEIFGQISTNPNNASGGQNNIPPEEPAGERPAIKAGSGIENSGRPVIISEQSQWQKEPLEIQVAIPKAKVLGVKAYPDGTLLRSSDLKIYLIQGRAKKYINSLRELVAYRGRAIINATDEELSGYQSYKHKDGELIRLRGEIKVFVVTKGSKQYIPNLEELRAHYSGLEIFNISREEMALY